MLININSIIVQNEGTGKYVKILADNKLNLQKIVLVDIKDVSGKLQLNYNLARCMITEERKNYQISEV